MRCSENRFCSALEPETRSKLCKACVKSSYAAGSSVTMDFYRHFLVVDGLCLTRHHKTGFMYRPGDMVITPHPDRSRSSSIPVISFDESATYDTVIHSITLSTIAYFEKEAIDELLEDPCFMRVSYANLMELYSHVIAFLLAMNSSSAYDAVQFTLKYCSHNGIGYLTHDQISKITGISRSTVTSIMHEIALAEPELLQ